MSKKDLNTNDKLKRLSDGYEVPINDHAWEKMEALMDSPPPQDKPFISRIFKLLLAMILLLVALYFSLITVFTKQDTPVISNTTTVTNDINTNTIDPIEEEKTATNLITPKKNNSNQVSKSTTKKQSKKTIALIPRLPLKSATIFPNTIPGIDPSWVPVLKKTPPLNSSILSPLALSLKDSTFVDQLKSVMAEWKSHTAMEKVYLHFDRLFFKPGESIWFNVFLRDANSFKVSEKSELIYVEFIAPNGKVQKTLTLVCQNGVAAGDIQTTTDMPGGTYKIKAYTNWQKNTDSFFERDIQIQKTVLPRLRMELDFAKEAYGAGDEVVANLDLNTLTNTPLSKYDFSYVAKLAGNEILKAKAKTDKQGKAKIKFKLPKDLNSNDGLLNVLIKYNGQQESIARSIPIVLNKIDLQFFPEGGQAIAGINGKLAFKAINEYGKPADIEGVIFNKAGNQVSTFSSYHQGMGAIDWTPKTGEKYVARITKPANILDLYPIPIALDKGYDISVKAIEHDSLFVAVSSTEKESMTLIVRSRDQLYHSAITPDSAGTFSLGIPIQNIPLGIAQLTLFDSYEVPQSERLVFLNPDKKLDIQITTDKEQYLPREEVKMTVAVKDQNGNPMPGHFSLSVVDNKLLSHADDKQGHILSSFLLESELEGEVVEPNFYFDKKEKDKDRLLALDYLMMTQGWRRYNWDQIKKEELVEAKFQGEKAIVAGKVIDQNKKPIAGIPVRLTGHDEELITDKEGRFSFNSVKLKGKKQAIKVEGNYLKHFTISKLGDDYTIKMDHLKEATEVDYVDGNSNIIKGVILEKNTNEPLIGATIMVKGTTTGTMADLDGTYQLDVSGFPSPISLVVSYTGYASQEFTVVKKENKNLVANVVLDEGVVLTEAVVISAKRIREVQQTAALSMNKFSYRKLKKSKKKKRKEQKANQQASPVDTKATDLAEAPAQALIDQNNATTGKVLTAEDISKLPTRNINAIAATSAGLKSNDNGDQVTVRGSRDGATNYYIDGVRVTKDEKQQALNQFETKEELGQFLQAKLAGVQITEDEILKKIESGNVSLPLRIRGNSSIDNTKQPFIVIDGERIGNLQSIPFDIDPQEIKDIKVLKGAAATALYGNRAKNGLVIIETKSGKGKKNKAVQEAAKIAYTKHLSAYNTGLNNAKKFLLETATNPGQSTTIIRQLDKAFNTIQSIGALIPRDELEQLKSFDFEQKRKDIQLLNQTFRYAYNFKKGFYNAREFYVPQYSSDQKIETRHDFRPTVYWNPNIYVNAKGIAEVSFYNSDELTSFKVTVEGISLNGNLGIGETEYFTQLPFGMNAKLPVNSLTGDEVHIPLTLANNADQTLNGQLTINVPPHFELLNKVNLNQELKAKEVKTIYLKYKLGNDAQSGKIDVSFEANGIKDQFQQNIDITSRGYPVSKVFAGSDKDSKFAVHIQQAVSGSVKAKLTAYPNTIHEITGGMERMLRQPRGCFEQTSSSNYPNLLVMDLMQSTNTIDQTIKQQAKAYLHKGYKRLLGFEVTGGGFDWYGKAPAHEGLTAYGLMQFIDMQSVYNVDPDLIDRTSRWLLSRRDGKGGWLQSKRALHRWSAQNPVGDAYIVWALSESGYGQNIIAEIEKSYEDAMSTKDPYIMALMVNVLFNTKDKRANNLLLELLKLQETNGSWKGLTKSMTHSKGNSLLVETTALAALAIMKQEKQLPQLPKAINFISNAKNGYGFGSTQSTVLAMKALVNYSKMTEQSNREGTMALLIDGVKVKELAYTKNQTEALIINDIASYFTNGKHQVELKFDHQKAALPYDLELSYHTNLPPTDEACKVSLQTNIQKTMVDMGENIRLHTVLTNRTNEAIPNTIAIIAIPAGLSLQHWQLKELEEKGLCDYYEIMDNQLVLHYRGMDANEVKQINLDLKADIPGRFESPASVAYLYYTNEHQYWSKPQAITINEVN